MWRTCDPITKEEHDALGALLDRQLGSDALSPEEFAELLGMNGWN